jgi:hypothetical protein
LVNLAAKILLDTNAKLPHFALTASKKGALGV